MSKLVNIAEKELANLNAEKFNISKAIEQTKQALKNREEEIKELDKNIQELEAFLNPKPKKGNK